jgi:hypothetical protein
MLEQAALIPQLGENDVPGRQRHDHHDDQCAVRDDSTLFPQRLQAKGVIDVIGCLSHGTMSSTIKSMT